jgi:hypothetical protein
MIFAMTAFNEETVVAIPKINPEYAGTISEKLTI